jgi:hypothetical protein
MSNFEDFMDLYEPDEYVAIDPILLPGFWLFREAVWANEYPPKIPMLVDAESVTENDVEDYCPINLSWPPTQQNLDDIAAILLAEGFGGFV